MSASVPSSTSLPDRKMATRSHSTSTSCSMCDDKKMVWSRALASCTQARNACSMSGSSPLVGSSMMRKFARVMNAAMMLIFCRFPFE